MNRLLGEIEIEILGEKHVLKPTFEGILEMERLAGSTVATLVNRFIYGGAGMKDVVAVIYGGIVGSSGNKPPFTFSALGEKVMQHGMNKFIVACATFVGAAYSGKPIHEIDAGRSKASDEKKKDEAEPPKSDLIDQPRGPSI